MSVIRVGSTHTYANGWDAIFGRAGSSKQPATKKAGKKSPKKASPPKAAKKVAKKKANRR